MKGRKGRRKKAKKEMQEGGKERMGKEGRRMLLNVYMKFSMFGARDCCVGLLGLFKNK